MAGRLLDVVFHDANAALVAWNLIVSALAVAVIVFFASSIERQRSLMPVAAGAVLATSPLLWFYGEVAEIYPTEMLAVLLIAWSAWIALEGSQRSMLWCAAALAGASLFKASAAALAAPVAFHAWLRQSPAGRRRSPGVLRSH